jgi:hypothetical protein
MAVAVLSQSCLLGCATRVPAAPAKQMPRPAAPSSGQGIAPTGSPSAPESRSAPLSKAVEQLVPSDHVVRWVDIEPARRGVPVSWSANQTWQAALAQAVTGVPGLTVDIGAGSRLVLIRRASWQKTSETTVTKTRPAATATHWDMDPRDKTLKTVVERWSQDAGWRTFWELDVDYPIVATASIDGSFEEAVSTVVRSMDHADVPLKAIFYRGNQVLRMVPRGME